MNEVERVYEELRAIQKVVAASGDVSTISAFGQHSAKSLLLVGASYFERVIIDAIAEHLNKTTSDVAVQHFTFHQAVHRKFFALFDFSADTKNINGFLSKFGPDYNKWAKDNLKAASIENDIQVAFLDFCRLRNSLVHNNYATYDINKTLDDVREHFDRALRLVNWINGSFAAFGKSHDMAAGADPESANL
jgi:hypothetical protein